MAERSKREKKPTLKYLDYCSEAPLKKITQTTASASPSAVSKMHRGAKIVKPVIRPRVKSYDFMESSSPDPMASNLDLSPGTPTKRKSVEADTLTQNAKRRSGRQPKPTPKLMEFLHVPSDSENEEKISIQKSPPQTSSKEQDNVSSAAKTDASDVLKSKVPVKTTKFSPKNLPPHLAKKKFVTRSPIKKKKSPVKKALSLPRLKSLAVTSKFPRLSLPTTRKDLVKAQKNPLKQQCSAPLPTLKENSPKPIRSTLSKPRSVVTKTGQKKNVTITSASMKPENPRLKRLQTSKLALKKSSQIEESLPNSFDTIKLVEEDIGITSYVRPPMDKNSSNSDNNMQMMIKKFLFLGTKVAHSISESLKLNETSVLTTGSAFEKKCIRLVHAIAEHGRDLEAEDMEKILDLLDEVQEERKAYRQDLLQNLKVAHLTNMASYAQMLKLLKSL